VSVHAADLSERTGKVLFDFLPTRKQLRIAVATIVRSVQLQQHLTDDDMAQAIGVSAGTIRNARNEEADLGALAILSIGKRFGEQAIQPYADLIGALLTPLHANHVDPVPALGTCIGSLSNARNLKDRRDALPAMRIARDALNNCITETEQAA
jgi:DNA-binding XRE family transcriptional regulator